MHYASIGSYLSRILLETNLLFSCIEGMKYSIYILEPLTATKAIYKMYFVKKNAIVVDL